MSKELAKIAEIEMRCFGQQNEKFNNMNVLGIQPSLTTMDFATNQHIKMFQNLSRNVEMSQQTEHADIIQCQTCYTHLVGVFSREPLLSPLILTIHSLETHRPWKVEQ